MERVGWIDFLKGIAMILILVFHTEVYYKQHDVTPYYIYTTNTIVLFYFISGYLFFRNGLFQWRKRITSIVRSLLIPYFIFTTLIAIPKLLIRQMDVNWTEIATNIITGQASWFIAALIVAETVFSIVLWITRGKQVWLSSMALLCFITYYLIPFNQHNYWQWQDALLAVTFLYLGYVFHRYKDVLHTINNPLYSLLLLLVLIFIKIYEYHTDFPMRNVAIENMPLFMADVVAWLLLVISVIPYIPHCRMIEWTGQHCIVYYFLCGGCPLIISMLMSKLNFAYEDYLYRYMLTLLLVYMLTTALTWLIYRYFPFLTGNL